MVPPPPYGMNAAAMSSEQHERGIHVVSAGKARPSILHPVTVTVRRVFLNASGPIFAMFAQASRKPPIGAKADDRDPISSDCVLHIAGNSLGDLGSPSLPRRVVRAAPQFPARKQELPGLAGFDARRDEVSPAGREHHPPCGFCRHENGRG